MSFVHEFVQGPSPWTLLMLHGTGGDQRDLLPLGEAILPSASLLSPLGMVREGTAPRYFRRHSEGVFDMDDLVFRTNELADWLVAKYAEYKLDAEKIVAVGYSNGATMASSLMLLRPEVVAGEVAFRPSVPFVPDPLPDLVGKNSLLIPGEQDTIVLPSQGEELSRLLAAAGGSVTLKTMRASHGLTRGDVEVAQEWVRALTA